MEYETWWRVEVLHIGIPDCTSRWVADDDHDTETQAGIRKRQLEAQGRTVRVRKMRGRA